MRTQWVPAYARTEFRLTAIFRPVTVTPVGSIAAIRTGPDAGTGLISTASDDLKSLRLGDTGGFRTPQDVSRPVTTGDFSETLGNG